MVGLIGPLGWSELLILLPFIVLYFLPVIVAAVRRKKNLLAIGLINVLLGWTVVGWIVAMVWALTTETVDTSAVNNSAVARDQSGRPVSGQLCSNCGKYSQPEAVFCAHCGNELGSQNRRNEISGGLPSGQDTWGGVKGKYKGEE